MLEHLKNESQWELDGIIVMAYYYDVKFFRYFLEGTLSLWWCYFEWKLLLIQEH